MTNSEKDDEASRFNYLNSKRDALKVRNEILRKDMALNKQTMIKCKKEMNDIKRRFKNENK